MASRVRATIDDLYKISEKAELVNGEIVIMSPTGIDPKYAGDEVFFSLRIHVRQTGIGRAVGDNAAFRVNLPHRESFSPDAAYVSRPASGMKFFEGAPDFAVEVRSAGDYGPAAEKQIAAKRADYFAAGTYVNGQKIAGFYDSEWSEGAFALRGMSSSTDEKPVWVQFDNLRIWDIDKMLNTP